MSAQSYRVYYDKDEKIFKHDAEKSEVKTIPADSTTIWIDTIDHVMKCVEERNQRLDEVQICKECGEPFWFTNQDREWYEERNLHLPLRCVKCRKERKAAFAKKKKEKKQSAKQSAKQNADKILINGDRIHEIFMDCLFKEGETHPEYIKALGLTINVGFKPEKIEEHQGEIKKILNNLPKEFMEDNGGGYSFLKMSFDKNDKQWCDQPLAQELYLLGIASGWMRLLLPREVWASLPGGVPYVVVNKERRDVPVEHE